MLADCSSMRFALSRVSACRKALGVKPAQRVNRRCNWSGVNFTRVASVSSEGWSRQFSLTWAITSQILP